MEDETPVQAGAVAAELQALLERHPTSYYPGVSRPLALRLLAAAERLDRVEHELSDAVYRTRQIEDVLQALIVDVDGALDDDDDDLVRTGHEQPGGAS